MSDEQYVSDAERELIAQAIAGNGQAFERLMAPHLPKIKRKIRSYFRRPEDAEDALQEFLLATYRRLGTFKFQSKFGSWLFVCTVRGSLEHLQRRVLPHENISIDACRAVDLDNGSHDGVHSSAIINTLDSQPDSDPAAQLEAKQQLQALDATLNKLPAAFRQAFYLREVEQLGYEEIAVEMGCCVGTVKSRINRARQAVYETLGMANHH